MFFVMTEEDLILNVEKFEGFYINESADKYQIILAESLTIHGDATFPKEYVVLTCDTLEQAELNMEILFSAIKSPEKNAWNAKLYKENP